MAHRKREVIRFVETVAAASGVEVFQDTPAGGIVKDVLIHWPPGCQALVDVAVSHQQTQFCPREGYLNLDDVTPTFKTEERVENGEEFKVEIRNADALNPHTITVVINLERDHDTRTAAQEGANG